MKKCCLIASVMIASIVLGGCNGVLPKTVSTDEVNSTEQESDFSECLPVTMEDVEFYRNYAGSSSVYTEYGIYKYEDSFVFMVNYFNCGNSYMDTYALTDEQQEAFLEELNQCSNKEEKEEEEGDGGYSSYGDVSVNGILYGVNGLNLDKLQIELQEDPVPVEDIPEELSAYEEADLTRMMEKGNNNIYVMSLGTIGEPAYIHMIKEQIEGELLDDVVTKVTVIEENEQDYVMELETENQEIYHVTVTYLGYVADIHIPTAEHEEDEQGGSGQTDSSRMVMVNGELYQDTGRKSTFTGGRCGNMDGSIDSQVEEDEIPTENNQSNFGTGYGYQYGPEEGTIEIDMNGDWWVFEKTTLQN